MTISNIGPRMRRRVRAAPTDERDTFIQGRSSVPSLCDEFSETMRGLVVGSSPLTVTHALLLQGDEPLTREGIAATIGRPTYEIEGVLATLEEQGWLLSFRENGLEKYVLRAPSTGPRRQR
jgi:hypothetical protein